MPSGVPWGPYLRFFTAAMLTAFAGAQTVHLYYRPLDDLEKLVDEEVKKRKEAQNS
ncbi:ubiquinol-cytochrome-c reductase complex assembly factor 6 [Diachasmimorpha longicaudata]|uniref:ubiquinol-cytochrome-c reductase complex assembly factor 6 n=1 Tax=Diachasmimorpha longicaudata TaxID=58733 RepID=UPI0030B8695E